MGYGARFLRAKDAVKGSYRGVNREQLLGLSPFTKRK